MADKIWYTALTDMRFSDSCYYWQSFCLYACHVTSNNPLAGPRVTWGCSDQQIDAKLLFVETVSTTATDDGRPFYVRRPFPDSRLVVAEVLSPVMDLQGDVDVLRELRRRVDDVETTVASLRLCDMRVSVSANCPRDTAATSGDAATIVRPRILPAFKSRSPPRSAANSGDARLTLFEIIDWQSELPVFYYF